MSRSIKATNPRTGQIDYEVVVPDESQIDEHCRRLRDNQKAWAAAPLDYRIGVMSRWADELEAQADKITEAVFKDTGRRRMSIESPFNVVGTIRAWCDLAPKVLTPWEGQSSVMPHVELRSQYVPYQLLGVISPWNVPFMLSMIDAAAGLIAGCAAIIKPSEVTPRFIEPVSETIAAVPELAKVLTYVPGDGAVGRAVVDRADIVCFTGSVATGRKVAEQAASRFIPAFLELGGKDPVIITKSADLDHAADAVLRGSAWASGQICYSIERVYVDKDVHDDFVGRLSAKAGEIELSYPDPTQGNMGPFIDPRQADIVDAHLDDALNKGAEIRAGGKSETHGGRWMRPTVVVGADHSMKIMTEETFGPVIPVMAYETVDQAVELANDTEYGLSAAVIAGDSAEATVIGEQLNAGGISLQDTALTGAILRDAEKMSFNLSGLGGTRMGPGAIMRFMRKKALMTNTGTPAPLTALAEQLPPSIPPKS